MRLSVNVPNFGDLPHRLGLAAMGVAAEAAGADGIWLADHLVLVDEEQTGYPYAADGSFGAPSSYPFYESLASAAFLAASTKRCRIGIGVLILPQRNVLEVAKAASTIDRLSGGRFVLGVGVGWNRSEMEALGYRFSTRGKRTDEMLRVLRESWTGDPSAYSGQEISLRDGVRLYPTPAQTAVPLIVGGMADVALDRAASLGDGWMAIANVDTLDLETLGERATKLSRMRAQSSDMPFQQVLKLEASGASATDLLPGAVQAVAKLGFDEVVIDVPWEDGIKRAAEVIQLCLNALDR
jgi:probable F420-dependent oxidoreductase